MSEASPPAGIVRRIYGNLGMLLGGKAAAGVISLVYMILAARALGPADYGVLVLVHGYVLTVGGIITFPGWHAVVRFGAQAHADGDMPRLIGLLRFAALVETLAGVAAILVADVLAPLIGPRLGWSSEAMAFAVPYSLAVLAAVRSTPAGYLQLMRRFDLLGIHNAIAPLVRLVGAAIALWLGLGLRGFLIAWLVAALAEWLSLWVMGLAIARRQMAGQRLVGGVAGVRDANPGLLRFMFAANADVTLSELTAQVTPLAIGWILGPAAAGLYAIAQRATVVIAQPAQILGHAAYSELAKLVAAGGHGAPLRRALVRCVGIAFASALPVVAVMAVLAPQVATLLGGKAFVGAAGLIVWLAAARLTLLIAPPSSAALIALGQPGLSVAGNMVASLVLLPLLPLLMLHLGLVGAGVHALAQAMVTGLLLGWFVWRESGAAPRVAGSVLAG